MAENEGRGERGRFLPGHKLYNPTYLPAEIKEMKVATKNELVRLAFSCLDKVEEPNPETQSKLQFLLNRAVALNEWRFIMYLLDHAVGKPIQPAVKNESNFEAKTLIRKLDGTVIEYKMEQKEK